MPRSPLLLLLTFSLTHPTCHSLSNNRPKKPLLRRIRSALAPFTLPWYENGVHFSCTGCGKCCKVDGDVWLAPEEVDRITSHLGTSLREFRNKYIRAEVVPENDHDGSESWLCLQRQGGACVFLDSMGKCSIYDVRPIQCETYPFWPSLIRTREDWEDEAVVPEGGVLRGGTGDRFWSEELGGCEGILLGEGQCVKESDGGREGVTVELPVVPRKEIVSKMRAAKKHWKRFPVDEIKQSTWYL